MKNLSAFLCLSLCLLTGCSGSNTSVSEAPPANGALSSGEYLAFVNREGIAVWNLKSGNRQAYRIEESIRGGLSASPRGVIAYMTEPETTDVIEIHFMGVDGVKMSSFRHQFDGYALTGARISQDGNKVAYGLKNTVDGQTWAQVYIAQKDGSQAKFINIENLGSDVPNGVASPAWLPDGRLIVSTRRGFLISDSALSKFSDLPGLNLANPDHLSASPNGQYILFDQERGANVGSGQGTFRAIWCLDLKSLEVFQVSKGVIEQFSPTFSADGASILFNDSSPFAIPGVGGFRRDYLSMLPFSKNVQDVSDRDVTVKDENGDPLIVFGSSANF